MKKDDLTKRFARQLKLTRAAAADELDRVVHEILARVRKGEPAHLPGLGVFSSGQETVLGLRHPVRPGEKESR